MYLQAFDRILKAYMFNRPEAGADYVERGDYNLLRPEGSVILRVDFSRTVKPGSQLDMSIIKRPQFSRPPDMEECPYCGHQNQNTRHAWIHW
jgi:hypothetical protein